MDELLAMQTTEKPTRRKYLANSLADSSSPPKRKTNESWKRRKEELQRLRVETQAMQAHVTFLTLKKTYEEMLDADLASEEQKQWKNSALTERQKRNEAFRENARLKKELQRCVETRDGLQTALTAADSRRLENVWSRTIAAGALQVEMRTCHKMDLLSSVVFNMLEHSVNARLHEAGALFYESSYSIPDPEADQVRILREDGNETDAVVECKHSRVLPFTTEATSIAAWSLMQRGVTSEKRAGRIVQSSDDLVASYGRFTHPLKGGGSVEIRAHCLMKRVHVPGGFVALVESASEWLADVSASSAWRHVTRDSGCFVACPLDPRGSTSELCRMQAAIRVRTSDCLASEHRRYLDVPSLLARNVSDIVISYFQNTMIFKYQLLDNELLDAASTAWA